MNESNTDMARAAPRWSSNFAFIMASAGLAVGLGNIWRFPYLVGENGGGAFVIVYLACVLAIGFPVMLAELAIGRRGGGGRRHPVMRLAAATGAGRGWAVISWLSVLIPFVGLSYYSVVAGWVLDYAAAAIIAPDGGGLAPAARFDAMLASPWRMVASHAAFSAAVAVVVALGVHDGIERMARLLMPLLFVLLVALAIYAAFAGEFMRTAAFLFRPDFSAITAEVVLAAAGQAFFSLAIGFGALITFGSYTDKSTSLPRSAGWICTTDTAVALIAGFAIFPIVFAGGLAPDAGPGLIFVTMPAAFDAMPGGAIVGAAFFILLFVAAFTTGIATLETVVASVERRGLSRAAAAALAGAAAWALGVAAALSFNLWADFRPLAFLPGFAERDIFNAIDFAIVNLLLPLNSLAIALFAGWALSRRDMEEEIGRGAVFTAWRALARYVAPVAIFAILIDVTGLRAQIAAWFGG